MDRASPIDRAFASMPMHRKPCISRAAPDCPDCPSASQVPAVQEYIKDLLDSDQKFLAFAHHTSLLDGMETAFRKCAVPSRRTLIRKLSTCHVQREFVHLHDEHVAGAVTILQSASALQPGHARRIDSFVEHGGSCASLHRWWLSRAVQSAGRT